MSGYFKNIKDSIRTLSGGLKITLGYLADARKSRTPIGIEDEQYFEADKGIVTLQYPHESFPVPDNGRYRLHNEIDDCIVCDKCAKVCPVDCIEIEPIKATETIGLTSDGTPKRIHAAKFDIDMGKCCFCGLCTTVCPTECLTMTKVYDFSEYDVRDHNYSFAEMDLVEIAQKRKEAEEAEKKKAEARLVAADSNKEKVVAKPGKPVVKKEGGEEPSKPKFRPKVAMKPKTSGSSEKSAETSKSKPVFRPKPMVKKKTEEENSSAKPKPVIKAKPKPVIKKKADDVEDVKKEQEASGKPKPKFRPRPMIPKSKPKKDDES
ncbi:MAG: 4Fe-4S binding protein [Cyclobacteriaceae bacterium]